VITVKNLTKFYGEYMAIEGVSFAVNKGEIVGFLGPNGAGKTTTMKILAGFLPATSGSAVVAGFDVVKQSLDARRNIGYLPETVPLYTDMTVRQYLDYMGSLKGMDNAVKKRRIDEVIEICRIGPRAAFLIQKLSKGYRQRVGLAQALLAEPSVLILDEPTIGLDPEEIISIRNVIKDVGKDKTVILSSHILGEVQATCSRIIIINDGHIAAADTTRKLTERLESSDRVHVVVRGPGTDVARELRTIQGVEAVAHEDAAGVATLTVDVKRGVDVRDRLATAVVQKQWGLLELRQIDMSLEEIFLRVTSADIQAQSEAEEPRSARVPVAAAPSRPTQQPRRGQRPPKK
jgi:ABC-2 type transport system ATP-binding protein